MINQRDTYKFCTYCRSKLKEQDEFKICTHCNKHYYFNAKPTISTVLTNSKGEILLTKRAREPFKDWWDLPGGFVEEGETLEQAVRRELKEETGLEVKNLSYVGSISEDYHFREEVVPVVAAFFTGEIVNALHIKVADDVSDYKFVAKKDIEIDKIAFENQREFLRTLIK